jgi:hypothetical protein
MLTLSEETGEAIRDYIEVWRPNATDEYGREPLLATDNGRISKSTIRGYCYKWTRPVEINSNGPEGHDVEECEAGTAKGASKCSASRSPRAVRSGYITAMLNGGASYEAVGYRVGATKEALRKHYDHPSDQEERERHRDEIAEASSSSGGGYSNINGTSKMATDGGQREDNINQRIDHLNN